MPPADDAPLLAHLASALHHERDHQAALRTVVTQAVVVLPDAEHVSVTVREGRGWRTAESTSELALRVDELQYALEEGPCVDSTIAGPWRRSGDLARDDRWPAWAPRAAGLGVGSLVSVGLSDGRRPFGAVNLYATRTGRFVDPRHVERTALWATHVSAALCAVEEVSGLRAAMASRHAIGVAQGLLMARYDLDQEQAFRLLCRLSSHRNEKVRDLAVHIAATRELPDSDESLVTAPPSPSPED